MKIYLSVLFGIVFFVKTFSQESINEDALEQFSVQENQSQDDDSYHQSIEHLLKNPLNLNTAETSDLQQFTFLSALQVSAFIRYRNLAGKLLSIYELQAVPLWDNETIQRILPYIKISRSNSLKEDFMQRIKMGEYSFLSRLTFVPGRFENNYKGGREQVFSRLQYRYGNLLQWGLTGEKDPGEAWFGRNSGKGFDFYSAHFFLKNYGIVKALVVGDYSVNIGQGLIQWQSMAFKKSPDILLIKRQAPVLRPYHSSGEVFFQRGAGFTIGKKEWALTGFYSSRKMDGAVIYDTISEEKFIKSWKTDGLHRTDEERALKNKWKLKTYGFSFSYGNAFKNISFNSLHYEMNASMQKPSLPYQYFSFKGQFFTNLSVDWSMTYRNIHLFGEFAIHQFKAPAFISGLLASLDNRLSLSFIWRNISPSYQSLFGNAFMESSSVSNEKGLFAGFSFKPTVKWKIEGYADVFHFPWLKYRKNAPSYGTDLFIQISHRLGKDAEILTRYKEETDSENFLPSTSGSIYNGYPVRSRNWRTQFQIKLNHGFIWRARAEIKWVYNGGLQPERGFLAFSDLIYRPLMKPYSAGFRFQFFETDSYESRVYAYENDVLFRFSIPAFQGKGKRYYINLQYDFGKKCSFWFRWSQTVYMKDSSYLPVGKNQSGLNFQLLYRF